jgi:hypothetical protein
VARESFEIVQGGPLSHLLQNMRTIFVGGERRGLRERLQSDQSVGEVLVDPQSLQRIRRITLVATFGASSTNYSKSSKDNPVLKGVGETARDGYGTGRLIGRRGFCNNSHNCQIGGPMRLLALFAVLVLTSCATNYQPQGFTGGYSDFLTAPDEAVITFHGNGYTAPERVGQMAALRCAEVTLEHGYRTSSSSAHPM